MKMKTMARPPIQEVEGFVRYLRAKLEENGYRGKVFLENPAALEERQRIVRAFELRAYPSGVIRVALTGTNNKSLDFYFFIQGSIPFTLTTNPLPTEENMEKRLLLGNRWGDERDMVMARIPEEWGDMQGVVLGINSRVAGLVFSHLTTEVKKRFTEAAFEILKKRRNGIFGEERLAAAFEMVTEDMPQLGITSDSFTVAEDDRRHGMDRQQFVWSDRGGTQRFVTQVKTSERDAISFAERYPGVPVVTCYLYPYVLKDGGRFFEEDDTEAFAEVLKEGSVGLLAEYLAQAIAEFRAGRNFSQPRNPLMGCLRWLVKKGVIAGAYLSVDRNWARISDGQRNLGWRLKVYVEDAQGRRGSFYAMALRERLEEFLAHRRNPKAQAFLLERSGEDDGKRVAEIIEMALRYSAPPVWQDKEDAWRRNMFTESAARTAPEMRDIDYAKHLLASMTALPSYDDARTLAIMLYHGKLVYAPQSLVGVSFKIGTTARKAHERLQELFEIMPMWKYLRAPQESV